MFRTGLFDGAGERLMVYNWKSTVFLVNDPDVDAAVAAKLDPKIRALQAENDLQGLEDFLLVRINETPFDLAFFIPAFRHFAKNKRTDLLESYLDLLNESYRSRNATDAEISLARALLQIWPESTKVRKFLVERLHAVYPASPNFQRLETHCKVQEAVEPLAALKLFENWLRFDEGQGVYLPSRGVGKVREVNPALSAIRVTFPEIKLSLSFKPDEALRLLEPLCPGHFLLDKLDRLPALQQEAKNDPGATLRRLFTSVNRTIPLTELREILAGIVPAASWSSWWTQARKDRRLTLGSDNVCCWNDSADDADSALLSQFIAAPERDKLDMAKKHAKRSPKLAAAMTAELLKLAEAECQSKPALALELLLAIERLSPEPPAALQADLASLIARDDATELILAIGDRNLRKRTLTLVQEGRSDWPAVYTVLVKSESDAASLGAMYDALRKSHPDLLGDLTREVVSSPVKAPALFAWLCRELPSREELLPFANWNFLQQLLQLLGKDVIKEQNAALRKLFDEEGAVYTAARKLEPDQAAQFIALLERDSSLEAYRKTKLLRDLRAWFPHTQEEPAQKTFFVSREALTLRQEEFTKLTTVDIPQNTEEIIKARAHGDLRENFEYHAARTRQEMLSSRAKTLHDELQFARPIDPAKVDAAAISVGTSVRLAAIDNGDELTVSVLGPWDSDPGADIYSYLAPAGNALLGKRRGDQVLFNEKPFKVVDIAVWKAAS
jgi:transcription elongation factor GreA